MPWIFCGKSRTDTISKSDYERINKQVQAFASKRPWNASYKLQLRFKGQFCYVDALEKDETVSRLGRLRYEGANKWSVAFYTYSNERYEPCMLPDGSMEGSLEDGLYICEAYLI